MHTVQKCHRDPALTADKLVGDNQTEDEAEMMQRICCNLSLVLAEHVRGKVEPVKTVIILGLKKQTLMQCKDDLLVST